MALGNRLALLGATAVGVVGLSQAASWALLWAAQPAEGGLVMVWLPLLGQVALTVAVAAAVAWHLGRHARALKASLGLLRDQALALEQGRCVVVEDPPLPEAVSLARSLNAAVRKLQGGAVDAGAAPGDALRRMQRSDAETGFDSRFTFLRRLTDRLAARETPETAVLLVSAPPGGFGDPHLHAALADAVRAEQAHEPDTFVGRISDREVALCLPVHGEAAAAAARVATALAAAGAHDWTVMPLDALGGRSLSAAMQAIEAAAAGRAPADPASADGDAGRSADAGAEHAELAETLRAGRVRLGEFPVLDPYGQLLHLECPLRLQRQPGGPFEPAARWLAAVSRAQLTTQVDLAAIDHALAAIAADGIGRCVHVAAESLSTAEFVSSVRARLEQSGDAARRLWIEIAEVSFERLPTRLRNAGTAWRRCGARVGIEHAGAALRGLVRLGELDIDYVKIDGSFVRGLSHDAEQRDWARGLVAFAHEFGASVYAEGVDAPEDLAEVWELGFDGATGHAVTEWQRRELAATADQAMSPA